MVFAIIWHITLATSSGVWLSLSTVCAILPEVVISLWGGVWADRYNRKHLIMAADAFIALATLGLALAFWSGLQRIEVLLAASAVRSIGSGIQTPPAVNAIFPQLVPQEGLTRVQGINQTASSVLMLLSPAVGGLILSVDITWAFMLDVVTATLAILVLSFIKVEKVQRERCPRARPGRTQARHQLHLQPSFAAGHHYLLRMLFFPSSLRQRF